MKEQVKILMAESSDIYHDGRVLKEATALQEHGYKITILGFRNQTSQIKKYPFDIKTRLIASKNIRVLRNLSIAYGILFLNIRILFTKARVYHAHNTMVLPGMYLASKLFGGKFFYDSHEVQWELNKVSKILEAIFIRKADAIINVSEGRADSQSSLFKIPRNRITVISNYPQIPKSVNEIMVSNDNPGISFVFSGGFNLEDNKLDNFVQALKSFPNCKLYLLAFGYGSSKVVLENFIAQNNLKLQVVFLDLVEPGKVISVISKYDVAVNLLYNPKNLISYKYHGINKMYEYLLAGLPVLTSDMESFINEFEKNNVGKSVDPLDIESIKMGIQFFLDKKNELHLMKTTAQKLAIDNFNWASQSVKLIELYNKMM
jgi:glycosyltransferase involved in cell wall biosynthesis